MDTSQDDLLFDILSKRGNIVQFFESVFGFLYRRTDFFKVQEKSGEQFGFPPGVAQKLILKIFKQWQDLSKQDEVLERMNRLSSDGVAPSAIEEVEIGNEAVQEVKDIDIQPDAVQQTIRNLPGQPEIKSSESESHNGAVQEGYSWSQTICDVDVSIQVPSTITKGKQVLVEVSAQSLSASIVGSSEPLICGDFPWKTKKEEAVWSLNPGKDIQVHLEKSEDRYWDCLLTSESKIDLRHIDPSRPLDEFSQADQMKVQELVWSEQQRSKEVPVTSTAHQPRMQQAEEMLKQAWHQEGSPFKNMPYDPSLVTFENNDTNINPLQ